MLQHLARLIRHVLFMPVQILYYWWRRNFRSFNGHLAFSFFDGNPIYAFLKAIKLSVFLMVLYWMQADPLDELLRQFSQSLSWFRTKQTAATRQPLRISLSASAHTLTCIGLYEFQSTNEFGGTKIPIDICTTWIHPCSLALLINNFFETNYVLSCPFWTRLRGSHTWVCRNRFSTYRFQ